MRPCRPPRLKMVRYRRRVWGGFDPPAKNRRVWGAAPPSPNFRRSVIFDGPSTVSWKFKIFRFWLGSAAPQTPRFLAGGALGPPVNGHPQHLIEAAKWGRLDQMLLFSAPLTTRAPLTTVRDDRPPAVCRLSAVRSYDRRTAPERPPSSHENPFHKP